MLFFFRLCAQKMSCLGLTNFSNGRETKLKSGLIVCAQENVFKYLLDYLLHELWKPTKINHFYKTSKHFKVAVLFIKK